MSISGAWGPAASGAGEDAPADVPADVGPLEADGVHTFVRAVSLLETHRSALEEGARRLLEVETLTGDELPRLDAATPAAAYGS